MRVAPFGSSGVPMCDKCDELDRKIEHYNRIAGSINDQLTFDRIKELVEEMRTRKAALHISGNTKWS
jgi:hypothetical protein